MDAGTILFHNLVCLLGVSAWASGYWHSALHCTRTVAEWLNAGAELSHLGVIGQLCFCAVLLLVWQTVRQTNRQLHGQQWPSISPHTCCKEVESSEQTGKMSWCKFQLNNLLLCSAFLISKDFHYLIKVLEFERKPSSFIQNITLITQTL